VGQASRSQPATRPPSGEPPIPRPDAGSPTPNLDRRSSAFVALVQGAGSAPSPVPAGSSTSVATVPSRQRSPAPGSRATSNAST